ncbi:MAG: transferrin-binding protein-like solute binding protein [Paracoccaceae bacterium]
MVFYATNWAELHNAIFYKTDGGITITLLTLSACGAPAPSDDGGGDGGGTPPSYEPLDSTADAVSVLGGTALHYSSGASDIITLEGSLEHGSGKLTIDDGVLVFVDPDGLRDGTLTDSDSTAALQSISAGYDYAMVYSHNYTKDGTFHSNIQAIIGVATQAADIPQDGSASYIGKAQGSINPSPGAGLYTTNGIANVDIDFSAGKVDVLMTWPESPMFGPAPLDTITITGMDISGNTFSGGVLTTRKDGTTFDYSSDRMLANGNFYGYDDGTSQPAEVGGVFRARGSNGSTYGTFIAK